MGGRSKDKLQIKHMSKISFIYYFLHSFIIQEHMVRNEQWDYITSRQMQIYNGIFTLYARQTPIYTK